MFKEIRYRLLCATLSLEITLIHNIDTVSPGILSGYHDWSAIVGGCMVQCVERKAGGEFEVTRAAAFFSTFEPMETCSRPEGSRVAYKHAQPCFTDLALISITSSRPLSNHQVYSTRAQILDSSTPCRRVTRAHVLALLYSWARNPLL